MTDLFPLLFSVMGDSVIVASTEGIVLDINPAAEQALGTTAAAVTGRPVRDAFPELAPLLENGADRREIRRDLTVTTGAAPRAFDATCLPVAAGPGPSPGYLLLLRDLTEHKERDAALIESDRRFHELVDLLPEVVYESDLTGRFTYVNDNSLRFFGYTREDMERGLNLFDHIVPEDRQRVREGIGRIASGVKTTGSEFTGLKLDGTRFPFLVCTTRVMHDGRCTGIRGILIDMTERKATEYAMQQAMKKLSLLNSITRHDILNKLTALSAYLNLAREREIDQIAAGHINRCDAIVRSVNGHVEFMRDYQEIGVHSPEWQDPAEIIRQVSRSLGYAGISLTLPEAGYEIFADPLFSRVIDNLLDNAIRHGERVTAIAFSLAETQNGLLLTCEDNGAGVPGNHKTMIFRKGFGKHTGLGLFLSREILGITGITIVESGEPGKGARFEILVPRGSYRSASRNPMHPRAGSQYT